MRMQAPKKEKGARKSLFVHKGDTVLVLSGKDEGKRGKVLEALPQDSKVIVEGVNIVKRHKKPRGPATMQQQAGIIEMPAALWASKVQVICPACEKPTRVKHRVLESGVKVRWCQACDSPMDQK